ncbi:MAG: T9SS type A sorting domain-containing protein [Draconibacterium sp.]
MKKLTITALLLAWGIFLFAQGIYNNGAHIVSETGSYWVVDNGGFTLTSEIASQLAQFENLIITNDASLILSAATCLTVNGDITVNSGGSFTLNSGASSTASLIVSGSATGNVTAGSYLAEMGKWHVVAAPVAAQNIWSFATLAGNSIAENASKRAVTEYVEGTNTWDTNYPTGDTEESFSAGSGYSVLRSSPGVVAYTGTLNTSDVTKPLTRSLYGWNALGNPYPSAINATVTAHETNNLITANTTVFDPNFAALYLWDAANDQYVIINNSGDSPIGTLAQDYIQAGQGFFVRAKDNNNLNFSITEAMQTHQTSTPLKSGETAWPTIQLAASGNGKLSKTVVTFNQNMTTGLDITYDAGMFKADKNFALYSRLIDDNGVDFAIQSLPESYDKLVVPLGIDVPPGTEITFSAETMKLPADAAIYLEDRAAKTITQLDVTGAEYKVTVTEGTKGTGNFFVHTSAATTAVNELANKLQVYTRDRAIYISGNLNSDDVIAVYGVDGKLHYRKYAEKTGLLRIDAAKMPAGVYLISIQQNTGRITRKVVISE